MIERRVNIYNSRDRNCGNSFDREINGITIEY